MDYKRLAIKMVEKMKNEEFLQMIYYFVKVMYKKDKERR